MKYLLILMILTGCSHNQINKSEYNCSGGHPPHFPITINFKVLAENTSQAIEIGHKLINNLVINGAIPKDEYIVMCEESKEPLNHPKRNYDIP